MQKHRALVLLTVLVAAPAWMPVSIDAQKGKPKPTATEVRSTFRDAPSDAISSDGYGLVFYETNDTTKTQNVLTETSAANYILDPFTATRGTGKSNNACEVQIDTAYSGGPYNAFSGCGANTLALLERESGPGASTAPVLIAVLDMPFAIQVDKR